mmetsp:Transcript_16943/g.40408  ORF Transcript_16943/g.40408 Transcript_16943/m.40408 type:complete len:213 (-) Transcript_16943:1747-2385(-)
MGLRPRKLVSPGRVPPRRKQAPVLSAPIQRGARGGLHTAAGRREDPAALAGGGLGAPSASRPLAGTEGRQPTLPAEAVGRGSERRARVIPGAPEQHATERWQRARHPRGQHRRDRPAGRPAEPGRGCRDRRPRPPCGLRSIGGARQWPRRRQRGCRKPGAPAPHSKRRTTGGTVPKGAFQQACADARRRCPEQRRCAPPGGHRPAPGVQCEG